MGIPTLQSGWKAHLQSSLEPLTSPRREKDLPSSSLCGCLCPCAWPHALGSTQKGSVSSDPTSAGSSRGCLRSVPNHVFATAPIGTVQHAHWKSCLQQEDFALYWPFPSHFWRNQPQGLSHSFYIPINPHASHSQPEETPAPNSLSLCLQNINVSGFPSLQMRKLWLLEFG